MIKSVWTVDRGRVLPPLANRLGQFSSVGLVRSVQVGRLPRVGPVGFIGRVDLDGSSRVGSGRFRLYGSLKSISSGQSLGSETFTCALPKTMRKGFRTRIACTEILCTQ